VSFQKPVSCSGPVTHRYLSVFIFNSSLVVQPFLSSHVHPQHLLQIHASTSPRNEYFRRTGGVEIYFGVDAWNTLHAYRWTAVALSLLFVYSAYELRVTWSVSVFQDEQKFLINFNLINERCLAIRVLYYLYALSAERHVITSCLVLWVIVSHARSQSAYLIRIVNIRASVVISCVCVKHFFILCPNVVTLLTVLRQWPQ
jgi:hypothetical protein